MIVGGFRGYHHAWCCWHYLRCNSGDFASTSSQMCGSWNLPMFLLRDGPFTLMKIASLMFLAMPVVLPSHNTKIVQGNFMACGVLSGPWWVMVLSCVPCISHQMFCQTHQCTLLHNLPFHVCTCILLHFS